MSKIKDIVMLAKTGRSYRSRTDVCHYTPTRIWVEASSHCNLACSFCGNRMLPKEQKGFMDMQLFKSIADQSAGKIRQFNLFHRGESLLHPDIVEMVRYAGSRGIRTRINTNGILLTPQKAESLIESGLDLLAFSFDGYNQTMYEANRPGADFDGVLKNIIRLLEIKKSKPADKPFVTIEIMELGNYPIQDLRNMRRGFRKLFEGLPLDKLVIRHPHNWGGIVEVDSDSAEDSHKRIPCPLPWHALVVFWDGSVLPCPQDFFGSLKIGSARESQLMEIWNSPAMCDLRKEHAHPDSIARTPCVSCDRILRRTIAGIPMDYFGRFLSENVFGRSWLSRILPH